MNATADHNVTPIKTVQVGPVVVRTDLQVPTHGTGDINQHRSINNGGRPPEVSKSLSTSRGAADWLQTKPFRIPRSTATGMSPIRNVTNFLIART